MRPRADGNVGRGGCASGESLCAAARCTGSGNAARIANTVIAFNVIAAS